jgi:hypothetical protein
LALGTAALEFLQGALAAVAPDLADLMLTPGYSIAAEFGARLALVLAITGHLAPSLTELLSLNHALEDRFWLSDTSIIRPDASSVDWPPPNMESLCRLWPSRKKLTWGRRWLSWIMAIATRM